MKKSLIFVGILAIGFANAQEGNVGINTDQPKATLDIQPNATNLVGTTNEGILAPRLSKVRVANIEAPVQGTLVYVLDENSTEYPNSLISAYTGADAKVAKITEKGYYFYNGTEWVKTSATDGGEWKFDGVDAIVAKRANETTAQDLIQIKNGKGLQQFIGSPDPSTLTYIGYNDLNQQMENNILFKSNADFKSVPNFNYITSDALADTSIFEEKNRPNNKIFTSDYRLFQFKPSHLDKVTTGQATYVPYYRVAHFNNMNKNIFDIWLNREQLYLGDNNTGIFQNTGIYEGRTIVSGTNPISGLRGIDSDLVLTGSNEITDVNGIRTLLTNTNGFTGKITNLFGNRSLVNFKTGGEINQTYAYDTDISIPETSNATSKYNYGYNSNIRYHSKNTTKVENIYSNRAYIDLNTAAAVENVQAFNSSIVAKSGVNHSLTSAWLSNIYENTNTSSPKLTRMDGVTVSNNYKAVSDVEGYSGVVIHNKVSQEATGNISSMQGININNEIVDNTGSQITHNYGIFINDIKGATNTNRAIHTETGKIRFGDLAQSGAGDRVVYADENGVLKTGGSIASNNGVQTQSGMTCTAENAGKINYTTIQKDGKDVGVFGFCMQKGTDYVWAYMLGGSNIYGTSANGAAFGQGL